MYKNIFVISIILFFLSMPLAAEENASNKNIHFTGNIKLTKEQFEEMKEEFTAITSIQLNELAKERLSEKNQIISTKEGEYILPVQVDNSLLPAFPTIRDQGDIDSSNAFAIGYYQITHAFGLKYGWNNKNDNDNSKKFSPRWAYNLLNDGVDRGTTMEATYKLLKKHGSIFWNRYPYSPANQDIRDWPQQADIWSHALQYRIKDAGIIQDVDQETGLTLLKYALLNGEVTAFKTQILSWREKEILDNTESIEDDSEIGKTACYMQYGYQGSHTLVIVGYNDDIWIDINENGRMEKGEKGALKVANSQGTSWGNDGYMWLAYDAVRDSSLVLQDQRYRLPAIRENAVFIMLLHDNDRPRMTAEFCISHARRSDLKVTLGISSIYKEEPELIWEPEVLNYNGGWSFDGTANVSEAVFVFDYTDIIEEFATVYNYTYKWYLIINDIKKDYPAELKSAKITDIQGNYYETTFDESLPVTFDEDTVILTEWYATKTGPVNYPPIVDAGKNIYLKPEENQASLKGMVIDETPGNPPQIDIQWSKLSGTGNVYFSPDTLPRTHVEVDTPGIYELQLQAYDYNYKSQDTSKIIRFDKTKIWSSDGRDGDYFGFSAAIFENDAVISSGYNGVYIYNIDSIGEWQEIQKIMQPYNDRESFFGSSVDIDGNQLIIGEVFGLNQGKRTGKAYIYEKNNNGIWEKTQEFVPQSRSEDQIYGMNVCISGNIAVVGNPLVYDQAGKICVYEKDINGTWSETAQLREDSYEDINYFGLCIDLENNTIISTSFRENCVYVFEKNSGVWEKKTKLYNPDTDMNGEFTNMVSLSENTFVANGKFTFNDRILPCLYIYKKNTQGNWVYDNKIVISQNEQKDHNVTIYPISIYQDTISFVKEWNFEEYINGEFKIIEKHEIVVYKKTQSGYWVPRYSFIPIDQKLEPISSYFWIALYENKLLYSNTNAYGINAESPGSAYIYIIDTDD